METDVLMRIIGLDVTNIVVPAISLIQLMTFEAGTLLEFSAGACPDSALPSATNTVNSAELTRERAMGLATVGKVGLGLNLGLKKT